MAFALVVEDGTGVSGANSYCSLDFANAYHEARLHAERWQEATDDDRSKALAMATQEMDRFFRWAGSRVDTTRDSPQWPRFDTFDRGSLLIDSNVVPDAVKNETAEIALRFLEKDRLRQSEDTVSGAASGGRSVSRPASYTFSIIPPSSAANLSFLTLPSTIRRVA